MRDRRMGCRAEAGSSRRAVEENRPVDSQRTRELDVRAVASEAAASAEGEADMEASTRLSIE